MSSDAQQVSREAAELAGEMHRLSQEAHRLSQEAAALADRATLVATDAGAWAVDPYIYGLTVFALACFVGYYVVWKVTPALHAPLMSVANAISGVVIVGAMIAAGPALFGVSKVMGFVAVVLASVNIFGGFLVTQRMLEMFRRKQR
jgi:H+-translocating NAD(P) transhydrogenase subunit alpha